MSKDTPLKGRFKIKKIKDKKFNRNKYKLVWEGRTIKYNHLAFGVYQRYVSLYKVSQIDLVEVTWGKQKIDVKDSQVGIKLQLDKEQI